MLIGITGTFCSGKDVAAAYLVNKGLIHYSLSDYLRSELRRRGVAEPGVQQCATLGDELRRNHGHDFLAREAIKTFEPGGDYVVTSIRHPREAVALLRAGCTLIGIDAPIERRYLWMIKNKPQMALEFKTVEAFENAERLQNTGDPNRMNLTACMSMADTLVMNDGSLDGLYSKVEHALKVRRS